MGRLARVVFVAISVGRVLAGTNVDPAVLDACPGYSASDVKVQGGTLTASLKLAGAACNVFGQDIPSLSLKVVYETKNRIHLKITDASAARYEVPESVLPRPSAAHPVSPQSAAIKFNYTTSPFGFSIIRSSTSEVLFSTASHPIIFEPQYLRVKTNLPQNANIFGLGEHTNTFRLDPDNTTLTLWSRDSYGVPTGSNLYGNHPVYFEQRTTGTHGVFLLNSNGMDVKLTPGALEYNVIGGVLDFYFLAGSTTDPTEVAKQYAEVVGTPAEVPYWGFGVHQCRFGYKDYIDVSEVITNYSAAGIPLETMWTDIDYMDRRRIFTVDPDYFPMDRMREIVDYLHAHDQHFILMTDPAVAYLPDGGYGPYDRGTAADIWLKNENGSAHLGLVWPGVTVYPDWFHPDIQSYWSKEFELFYSPETGLDIDGAWIDMNEPASFCDLPCTNPFEQAIKQALPPPRTNPPPPPDAPIFENAVPVGRRSGMSKRDLLVPQYAINNAAPGGNLSSKTAYTDTVHANGLTDYDTHNLYGHMMSTHTHQALLDRRPGKRTLVITRSTFAGAGASVGKWLGDNFSEWSHYRASIAGILGMASIYQVPMVGADICGFAENTTETLCARWAMLGAFYPFMRNHNADTGNSQEFYRWPLVTEAAINAIDIRYRLLDYLYTAFHEASLTGAPVANPVWFKYPKDATTYGLEYQWFFGDSILVSPVTEEGATSVSIYLPKDMFYDFLTLAPVMGTGSQVTLSNVSFTQIPVHIKGGVVLPLRATRQMTIAELRETDFEFVVAPGTDGTASGSLYVDDGESIAQPRQTEVGMTFKHGALTVTGHFGFKVGVNVARVKVLGVEKAPRSVVVNGKAVKKGAVGYDATNKVVSVQVDLPLTHGFTVVLV
ncbi:putative alpha/beta-glucosidase agdC [Mycena kentingensis (nom. inval.)]|nr:putative alpha/beta-glucosidase agdC [Mycena kentingensis (nom. inval.)]